MAFEQSGPITFSSPLGANTLLLQRLQGNEVISGLFHYRLELLSESNDLDFSSILGKPATVTLNLPSGDKQYVNGIVSRLVQGGKSARFTSYIAELRPWLWLLTMNSDCRIFQGLSAPDIIQSVFSSLNQSDFSNKLKSTYTARDYCVQYNETAFSFVSRLMEEEGIFYFFQHSDSTHTLVLADDSDAYAACPGLEQVEMRPGLDTREVADAVLDCYLGQQVTAGQFKTDDFNYESPSTELLSTASGQDTQRSLYEYPGGFSQKSNGESLSSLRLAALEAEGKTIQGSSSCRAFHTGCKFKLSGHPRSDANDSYVLKSVRHHATEQGYSNDFEAIPATVVYRPPRVTPKPRIFGAQTATVTGKSGEEIWTDSYARVKLKFHWDQSTARDETSSCWVRVAQGWAGKSWGALFLPRVGQEVVVSFLNGDPDRPLVTGSVYNAEQVTPYSLPGEATKSTIKSNSSKGGQGFNELRFEDKAGSEEIFLQAQKDLNVSVLNNQTSTVKQARTTTVSEKDDTLTVDKGNRVIQVNTGNETHTVKGKRDLTVTGNETHTNSGDFTQSVSGNFTLKVSGNLSIEVDGSISLKSGTDFTSKSGTTLMNQAGTSLTNKAGTSLTNDAALDLTNKAGASLTNQASVSISSKADASQTIESSGVLTVKGSIVQIN